MGITAPPDNSCPILKDFEREIYQSNVKNIIYFSSTGVYGNHNGCWVKENSTLKATNKVDKNRLNAENDWKRFCKKYKLNLNIIRIGAIYGPERINFANKNIIIKKNHYFSRVHV